MDPLPPAGWYPNPSSGPGERYFDGEAWTPYHRAASPQPESSPIYPPAVAGRLVSLPPARPPVPTTAVVVTGPKHALHAVLMLRTFWACGGWAWVWLIVALGNRRQVRVVALPPPAPPR